MFYSETLLQKNGPLSRIWLSYTMERKLPKHSVLQQSVTSGVEEIIKPKEAPLALRLSSQLLLGVVRIYQRKTRYLLDDCNEAIMKIKMAFRSTGNNDMAANMQATNRESLLLPDKITPYDNLDIAPPPDASWLLNQTENVQSTPVGRKGRVSNRDITIQDDDFDNSQFVQPTSGDYIGLDMEDLGLELDFGDGIEVGRDAPAARPVEEDIFSELGELPRKDAGNRDQSLGLDDTALRFADTDGDIPMGGDDDDGFQFNPADISALPDPMAAAGLNRARISESPLSDIDEHFAKEAEAEFTNRDLYMPEDETETTMVRRPGHRAKKQRFLVPDEQTTLSSNHIKQQQNDRTNIIRDAAFLPSDPFLLALMDMQKSGGFVSSVLNDGRGSGWAPELRGMLSMDAIRSVQELKRKRDSGIADMDSEQGNAKSPRLELDDEDDTVVPGNRLGDKSVNEDGSIVRIAGDAGSEGGDEGMPGDDDDSGIPVQSGDGIPVSLGTKHAVHVLRDLFGSDAATSADKRKKNAVVFQDLIPEKQTTKAEATKMFFECLVLATKDAIKVEQGSDLGAPIKIRSKQGLWGDWAEREAGGEIANQDEPERPAASAPVVAVEA